MPELPEVETTKTSLSPLLGQRVSKVQVFQPKLRWSMPSDLAELVGYSLEKVERRAKYLLVTFVSDKGFSSASVQRILIIHLGMSGSLQQHPVGTEKRKHDHLILLFEQADGQTQLHYHDPRRFGAVLWHKDYATKLLEHLGPEPLAAEFSADYLYHLIQRTEAADQSSIVLDTMATKANDLINNTLVNNNLVNNEPVSYKPVGDKPTDKGSPTKLATKKPAKRPITKAIKSVIMEQQIVVGVGNIYATESLYLSGINPATPAHQLTHQQLVVLVAHIKAILQKAIGLGGSTLRDFTVASGQTGYFQQTLNVYGKQGENCPQCATKLDNIKINGRASVYCCHCQPL